MIAKPEIAKWQEHAPWKEFAQVEQDLIISRALVEIFSDEFLREHLAFRGGTALHKLYLNPAPRYSEDIDLVQIKPGPIKPIIQRIDEVITFFEEDRKTQNRGHGIKALYRFTSEYEEIRMRLKLEINCREHFNVLDWTDFPYKVESDWFQGECQIRTYSINELLGTKLRALYQRSKGRDLFDLDYARLNTEINVDEILNCFYKYIEFATENKPPSKKEFLQNIEAKEKDKDFTGDMEALLRPEIEYNEQDFLNTLCGNKFNVFVEARSEKYHFDNKVVLAFFIPVHKNKPVYFNNQRNTFIRRGSADQRATQAEIDSMLRDRAFGTKTSELAPGTSRESLNQTSLNRYRDYMARFNPNASYNRFDEAEFLEKLRIIDQGRCTYAGLLLLGKREAIEKHFPDFRIDLLEIPGTSYSDAHLRYTYRMDEQENVWEYYFACFARLKQKVDVQFSLTAEGFGQELSAGLESIREALVNLLMHTDFFSPASPRIRIFTNHIEFYNGHIHASQSHSYQTFPHGEIG